MPHRYSRLHLASALALAPLVIGCSPPFASPEPTPPVRPVVSVPASPRPFPTRPAPTPSPTPTPTPVAATPTPVARDLETIIPTPQGGVTEEWEQAVRLFQIGNALQFRGMLDEAVRAYQDSIDIYPTAEAYTFLGWTLSWQTRYEAAIEKAKSAIALDPEYGNPYNDIGSYLIELGRLDEAVPWLEKAMQAKRYASPHFPLLNLADVWVRKGHWENALDACVRALLMAPDLPIPPFPTTVVGLSSPFFMEVDPSMVSEVPAVQTAITSYLDAWGRHDPAAVMVLSAPGSHESAKTVMLHLAEAKVRGSAPAIAETRVVHLGGDEAIVDVSMGRGASSTTVSYLLTLTAEGWRVQTVVLDLSPIRADDAPIN